MSRQRVITILVLAIWVLLGPMAMAFTGCATMGAMCEGPCGASACGIAAPTLSIAPVAASVLYIAADGQLPANVVPGLEPPPKSLSRSA